ncbi:hypothetical protein ASD50_07510 [Mesorhizobium sp. Root552]|uniref:Abi family protein n=1 Tax=Mesorhizobium sp. Root552 TaxID=1736555 RepID=UPI0006FB9225|nr:Abi family protein [Mesorhizobium sp. Root552]KQZ19324.1 hypothetical protein ASD50_07510 [Mesorhizobium sp. Root552]
MIKKKFAKPALSIDDQLQKMIARGLIVEDIATAKHRIENIGYYRLVGYSLPFQNGGTGLDRHHFIEGVRFETILDRYIFDRKLRLLILDAIERVEVSVRASLSNAIALKHSPHWYRESSLFEPLFDHAGLIHEIRRQIGHDASTAERMSRQDIFIRHYYDNYYDPEMPPSWMIFESISFGTISRLFEGLYKSETTEICLPYRVTHEILSSWLHSISYIRNLCAHHSRVWNKTLTIKPVIANKHKTSFNGNSKIYAALVVLQIMLGKIAPDNSWAERLGKLLDEHPEIPLGNMGFPLNWRSLPAWGDSL